MKKKNLVKNIANFVLRTGYIPSEYIQKFDSGELDDTSKNMQDYVAAHFFKWLDTSYPTPIHKEYIAIVCGGRDLDNIKLFDTYMDYFYKLYNFKVIIHGGTKGADSLANTWCESNNVPVLPVMADWKNHGKKAGSIRNRKMIRLLVESEERNKIVIAFPGGKRTSIIINLAKNNNLPLVEVPRTGF